MAKALLSKSMERQLTSRLAAAHQRAYELEEEAARRASLAHYGTPTPDLLEFFVQVSDTFTLRVRALDHEDATRLVDDEKWRHVYRTTPGRAITMDDWDTNGVIYNTEDLDWDRILKSSPYNPGNA